MRLHEMTNYEELSSRAAELLAAQITSKPDSVIGFATGATPMGLYKELIKMYNNGLISFEKIVSFNLDEYYGLLSDDPNSYRRYMEEDLFGYVDMNATNIHIPNGNCEDIAAECGAYDNAIAAAGGIDFQILGLGHDGHIGFNMPSDEFIYDTHLALLSDRTRQANARFFDNRIENVPSHAITLGMSGITGAKHILLLSKGFKKRAVLDAAMNGPITPLLPASILQKHDNIDIFYCD